MKSVLQQIIKQNKEREAKAAAARQAEIDNPDTFDNRRNFLKKTALGGLSIGAMIGMSTEDTIPCWPSRICWAPRPSSAMASC